MKRTCLLFLAMGAVQMWGQTAEADAARERERAAVVAARAQLDAARAGQNANPRDQLAAAIVAQSNAALAGQLNQVLLNGVPTTLAIGGVVKGRPFSATEENRSSQVLGNGARIENKTSTKLFRDFDGRTRTENDEGTIVIVDPVGGFRATLDPKTKTGTKSGAGGGGTAFGTVVSGGGLRTARVTNTGSELRENLGVQSVNGVSARGDRVTLTIPKGDIGNDRELKVITERWTSEDLQMLIKSVNTDPRYGDTTYELTGISLSAPAPSLFQIPSDYSITEQTGRGGAKGGGPVLPPPAPGAPGGRGRGTKQP